VADLKKHRAKGRRLIHAALFLQDFIEEDRAWAHLDIAARVWGVTRAGAGIQPVPTGFGVRTLPCRVV